MKTYVCVDCGKHFFLSDIHSGVGYGAHIFSKTLQCVREWNKGRHTETSGLENEWGQFIIPIPAPANPEEPLNPEEP